MVDKIVRIHHDVNMSNTQNTMTTGKRDDITLLVRNFNFPLPHALKSPTSQSVRFNPVVQTAPISIQPDNEDLSSTSTGVTDDNVDTSTTETSTTSDLYPPGARMERNARIKPYVDFSEYYENVEKRRKEGTLPEGIDF